MSCEKLGFEGCSPILKNAWTYRVYYFCEVDWAVKIILRKFLIDNELKRIKLICFMNQRNKDMFFGGIYDLVTSYLIPLSHCLYVHLSHLTPYDTY